MTVLDRLWCRLARRCPVPEADLDTDLRRIEEAEAVIRLAIRETDIALKRERSERRQRNIEESPDA